MGASEPTRDETTALATRIAALRARIDAAAERAGRDPAHVHLLGASKRQPAARIAAAARAGVRDFGENYVQEAAAKILRNKAREAVASFSRIHTVDSARLAAELARHAEAAGRRLPVLLQVNLSGEPQKAGVAAAAVPDLLDAVAAHASLEAVGLMTMPAPAADPELARPVFSALRALRDELRATPSGAKLSELSMGMSHDFEVAVEEGATWVRIGTDLFGPRPGDREDA
jgi:PLP dependent protein